MSTIEVMIYLAQHKIYTLYLVANPGIKIGLTFFMKNYIFQILYGKVGFISWGFIFISYEKITFYKEIMHNFIPRYDIYRL